MGGFLPEILAHDLPLKAHKDAVGHLQYLVEVRADEQNAHAALAGGDHLLVDEARRTDIQIRGWGAP